MIVTFLLNDFFDKVSNNKKMSNYYTVFWSSSVDGYFRFYRKFRKKLGIAKVDPFVNNDHWPIPSNENTDDNSHPFSIPNLVCLNNRPPEHYITSYGCICRTQGEDGSKYLIVKRPYSIDYVGFIGGSYAPHQFYFYIQNLPTNEREKILSAGDDFDILWNEIFPSHKHNENYYQYAKKKFNMIQPYLSWLLEEVPSRDPNGIYNWVFPKGKISYSGGFPETELSCAIREFNEETHDVFPLHEKYLSVQL